MRGTGIDAFDDAVRQSDVWLFSLMRRLRTEDRRTAYLMLRAAIHALRDRVGPQPAARLAGQLPMLLRGLMFEDWHPASTPTAERTQREFLDQARARLPAMLAGEAEHGVRAAFEVIADRIDGDEVGRLLVVLPAELRGLWPERYRDG